MRIFESATCLPPIRRSLSAAVLLALAGIAAAVTPTDTYFSAPPGSGSTFDGYQWALHPGQMNFTEAWDYTTGTARVAVNDGGTVPSVGTEYYLPHFGSWDFSSRKETVCPLTEFWGNGCRRLVGAVPEPNYVHFLQDQVSVPYFYGFGLIGGIDLSTQSASAATGSIYNYLTQSWESGPTLTFGDQVFLSDRITGEAIHATHVYSTIKAKHSNTGAGGIAGACSDCQVLASRVNGMISGELPSPALAHLFDKEDALHWMIDGGAQIVSASFGGPSAATPCNPTTSVGSESKWCSVLRKAKSRDVLFFAAAGNNLTGVGFPGRDPMAIAVGGTDLQKRLWDERLFGQEDGDVVNGCPTSYNSSSSTFYECGSNSGPELDFVAPARHILALVPPGKSYNGSPSICGDNNFGIGTDGVGFCTGTSMSTPLAASAGALIRSVNPLLQRDAVYETLKQTADGNQVFGSRGWGMPNVGNAVKRALGTSGRQQMQNRLTPMFAMKITGDRLYTVVPQLAVSAYNGSFAARPYIALNSSEFGTGIGLGSDTGPSYRNPTTEASPVRPTTSNYVYPGLEQYGYFARASFYVFSGKRSMFGVAMRPMERLLSVSSCDSRENTFGFTRRCPSLNGTESLDTRTFHSDGIEGYLLATCPAQFGSCNNLADPSTPQAVYLRYSASHKSFALLLDSQLSEPQFSTYLPLTNPASSAPLGYAFKNIDTDGDGVIDGAERVLGTNRLIADTDCDGQNDGVEYPTLLMQTTTQDPLVGPCGIP